MRTVGETLLRALLTNIDIFDISSENYIKYQF